MDTRYSELKKVLTVILKMYQKKKAEYQLNSIYDLKVRGEVPFFIVLKILHSQEYSSLNFQINLSDRVHFY